ncbi:toxin glutamine deamidase domain-containing protein [Streptomyces sp. NPDC087422]|uniref:toxin glutamine deamidase domain-containing protein n=1 Tax=Streptomyces sp. NPDC087422 TaxID=3365786 RepID=UPI003802B4E9
MEDVLLWGPGGRVLIAVTRGTGSRIGHVFNVVNVDGNIVFLDYQLGTVQPVDWGSANS